MVDEEKQGQEQTQEQGQDPVVTGTHCPLISSFTTITEQMRGIVPPGMMGQHIPLLGTCIGPKCKPFWHPKLNECRFVIATDILHDIGYYLHRYFDELEDEEDEQEPETADTIGEKESEPAGQEPK